MSYLSHTLEYPPASLSVWLPDEGIQPYDWPKRGIKVERVFKLVTPTVPGLLGT
jgi:hypothetical protein